MDCLASKHSIFSKIKKRLRKKKRLKTFQAQKSPYQFQCTEFGEKNFRFDLNTL